MDCVEKSFEFTLSIHGSKSQTTPMPHFDHPNNILHSTLIPSPGFEYLNIQTEILAFNLNINILYFGHSTQCNAKHLNANIQTKPRCNFFYALQDFDIN
jgi:hypothetical protein